MKRSLLSRFSVGLLVAVAAVCAPLRAADDVKPGTNTTEVAPDGDETKPSAETTGDAVTAPADETNDGADPAASEKIRETIRAIRGVEEIEKLLKEVAELRSQNASLAVTVSAQSAELKQLVEALRETIAKQNDEQKKQIGEVKTTLEGALARQAAEQKQMLDELRAELSDLNVRLGEVPPMNVQALINDEQGSGMAILNIGEQTRIVRPGESFSLLPDGQNNTLRTVHVKEITNTSVLLEVGPYRQPVIVQ